MENGYIQRFWFDSGCVHASSTELFALFFIFSASRWTSFPVLIASLRSTRKLAGLVDNVIMFPYSALSLVCGTFFLRQSTEWNNSTFFYVIMWTPNPEVEPRLSEL